MDSFAHTISPCFISPPIMRERVSVVALVVALHLAAFAAWQSQPPSAPVPEREMEVTVALLPAPVVQTATPPVQPSPRVAPVQPPRIEKIAPAPLPVRPVEQSGNAPAVMPGEPPPVVAAEPVVAPVSAIAPVIAPVAAIAPVIAPAIAPVAAVAPVIAPSAPAIPDVEPDYKASYLNNHLTYPLAARRMGLQGRVVLNVEVLAEGLCGQANIHRSSGHEILDNAAMQSVKTWHFIPARQGGRTVTKWFMVPIQFSLKDNEA